MDDNNHSLSQAEVEVGAEELIPVPALQLGDGNYVVSAEGVLRFYTKNNDEIFSIDANSVPYEKKLLAAFVQVYLLGAGNGRKYEAAKVKQRLQQVLPLVFPE